jgi:hypothetical protein
MTLSPGTLTVSSRCFVTLPPRAPDAGKIPTVSIVSIEARDSVVDNVQILFWQKRLDLGSPGFKHRARLGISRCCPALIKLLC